MQNRRFALGKRAKQIICAKPIERHLFAVRRRDVNHDVEYQRPLCDFLVVAYMELVWLIQCAQRFINFPALSENCSVGLFFDA